jgi:hypothetical protein
VSLSLRKSKASRPPLADPDGTILIPPADYLNAVRKTLGIISLDPCSTAIAQQSIEAQGWYRAEDAETALVQPWSGTVFLHPHPDGLIARYQLQKLLRDYLADRVTAAIILTGKTDWLRSEPLLLSFPFLLHYRRLPHWRWRPATAELERLNPSFNSLTIYLPAKQAGVHFDEAALDRFVNAFSSFGRIVLSEDLGENWEQHALEACHRMPIKPILTTDRLERYTPTGDEER